MNISLSPIMRFMKGQMLQFTPGMITCLEFEQYIDRYLEGSLSPSEAVIFDRHVKLCKGCSDYLDTYERTLTRGKVVFTEENLDEAVPDAVPSGLVKAIQEVKQLKH